GGALKKTTTIGIRPCSSLRQKKEIHALSRPMTHVYPKLLFQQDKPNLESKLAAHLRLNSH
ncbi:unnamed protein product, partial [Dovyalis caffra]